MQEFSKKKTQMVLGDHQRTIFSLIPTTYLLLRDCVTQSTKIGEKKRQNKQNHLINVVRMKSKTGATKKRKKRDFSLPPPPGVRGSVRGGKSIATLAKILLDPSRSVLIVTGAGLSVASGIPTFRGSADSIWSSTLWTNATRGAFLKDPLRWWNDFWLEYFPLHYDGYEANEGHQSLAKILAHSENSYIITQNVDGLQQRVSNPSVDWSDRLIQAHGMIGLYKCVNDGDKDFQAFSFSNKKPSTAEGGDDPDDKDCAHNVNEEGNDDNTPGVEDCSDKKDDKNDKTDNENLSTNVCTYAYEKRCVCLQRST